MIKVNRTKAIELIKDTNGKIFSVGFYKKDRSFREMVARLGVYSKRKTTNRKSFAHKLDNSYVLVFDMQKREYRMVNLETLKYIKTLENSQVKAYYQQVSFPLKPLKILKQTKVYRSKLLKKIKLKL